MTPFAALDGPLPKLGVIIVALLVAGVILLGDSRRRAGVMLGALLLAPVLLLADIWHSPQLTMLHRHPLPAAATAVAALAVLGGVATLLVRRPALLGPLAVLALPFRVPIQAGGTTSNLLVPLYLVVAAGAAASIFSALAGRREAPATGRMPGAWLERLLALYVVLYALQAAYSADFERALQQMMFFYVPFALLYRLLAGLEWTRRLLIWCLGVVAGLAIVFAAVGFVEYATKTLLLNPKLIAANDVHAYFTVNSVFFDPDIFGRFLALVMIVLAAQLLYGRDGPAHLAVSVVLAVLWGALVLTLSRSSLGALLVGLAILGAMRWKLWPVLAAAGAVIAIGLVALAISPKTFGLNQGLNGVSAGRASLIRGGVRLFGERPVWGYGSGSFVTQYRRHNPGTSTTLAASHTIPITIAAEQGLIGELTYVALVVAAAVRLLRRSRGVPARAAIAATFLALVFHTMLYADFLEDPITWTLLGVGCALALPGWGVPGRGEGPRPDELRGQAAIPA
ncbi:MAG: O-antigen ligase family protein [Solirubrobacteraceae bacterium]